MLLSPDYNGRGRAVSKGGGAKLGRLGPTNESKLPNSKYDNEIRCWLHDNLNSDNANRFQLKPNCDITISRFWVFTVHIMYYKK